MKIHNYLPLFVDCMRKWEKLPLELEFRREYYSLISPMTEVMFQDFKRRWQTSFYGILEGLDWRTYREHVIALDPKFEEARVNRHLKAIEDLFEITPEGEIVLFGAFTCMDGYARFDQGKHRVFLGVDESHGRGAYLDVLIAHELTHVIRESRAPVWTGFDLDPKMTHDDFTELQPVIEHLFSEGFSCVISETTVPHQDPWNYAYQTQDSLAQILEHGPAVSRAIWATLKNPDANYRELYDTEIYKAPVARFAHYVWAWQWVKHLVHQYGGGDPRALISQCSKQWMQDALEFELSSATFDLEPIKV